MANKNLCGVMMLALLCCVSVNVVFAQTAQINGRVIDSSGAVVPGAEITVSNVGTGIKRNVTSSDEGYYTVPLLQPGTYNMAVQKAGFKTIARTGVDLVVEQAATIDFQLVLGEVTETLNVEEPVVALNSTVAEVATNLDAKAVKDLPLALIGAFRSPDRRSIEGFIYLVPGVQGDAFLHKVNGGLSLTNEIYFDGVPLSIDGNKGRVDAVKPPFEAVDEFKMITSVFSAQYGQAQGVVSYHLTSGTNRLHGDVFEFLRNDAFDARGFFAPSVPTQRLNEYGFTVGGPVYIPKVYDGRNRTFFNVAWSDFKFRGAGGNQTYTMPTDAFKAGDFSALLALSNPVRIYDPETHQPFPGNRIDPSRFSSVSKQLLPLIPSPTSSALVNNIVGSAAKRTDDRNYSYKIDHNLTSNQKISFSAFRTDGLIPGQFGSGTLINSPLSGNGNNAVFGRFWQGIYTNVFRPNLLMTFAVNYVKSSQTQRTLAHNTSVDFPGLPRGSDVAFPRIDFSGPVAPSGLGSGHKIEDELQYGNVYANNFLWVKGRHSLNLGWDHRRPSFNAESCSVGCPGIFGFSNRTTSTGRPGDPDFTTQGHPFASFLLGQADTALFTSPLGRREFRQTQTAGYVQDDFKFTQKLTLNLGLRYDVFVPFVEGDNKYAYFDPRLPNPAAGGRLGAITYPGDCSVCAGRDRIADIYKKNFSPRIGFAYGMNSKTVIRGGWGVIYYPSGANNPQKALVKTAYNNGLSGTATFPQIGSGEIPGYGSWDRPALLPVIPPKGPGAGNGQTVYYADSYHGQSSFLQNWTVGLQRELPGNIILSVDYVGNKGTRLVSNVENLNQVDPKYLALGSLLNADINSPEAQAAGIALPYPGFTGRVNQALRPYPQYAGIGNYFEAAGSSLYNALQVSAQKRFSQGVQFLVSYTASRNYSMSEYTVAPFQQGAINTFNRKAEWAISPSDIPQNLVVSGLYELPIGPGKRVLSQGVAGKVLGGWQLGWVASYRSGTPISLGAGGVLPIFGGGNRPNLVPGVDPQLRPNDFDPRRDVIINEAAFGQPAPYTFGNAPRTLGNLRNFGSSNEDVNVSKRFFFTESMNLEFRAEAFNIFNRVVFGDASGGYAPGTTTFGRISSQGNGPRIMQFGLKFNF